MSLCPGNDGVEEGDDKDGYGQCRVPVITDAAINMQQMLEGEVHNRHQYDVKADDDKRAYGQVDDDDGLEAVQ